MCLFDSSWLNWVNRFLFNWKNIKVVKSFLTHSSPQSCVQMSLGTEWSFTCTTCCWQAVLVQSENFFWERGTCHSPAGYHVWMLPFSFFQIYSLQIFVLPICDGQQILKHNHHVHHRKTCTTSPWGLLQQVFPFLQDTLRQHCSFLALR